MALFMQKAQQPSSVKGLSHLCMSAAVSCILSALLEAGLVTHLARFSSRLMMHEHGASVPSASRVRASGHTCARADGLSVKTSF
jgi:hypothetical protein